MYIAYFDESGDDGFPSMSSPLFILTAVYLHNSSWKDNYQKLYAFRKKLKITYNLPVKQEFHARQFIQDKNPYHGLYSNSTRKINLYLHSFLDSLSYLFPQLSCSFPHLSYQSPHLN